MPSLLDQLANGDEVDLTAPDPPAGLIDAVKADGTRRRANRHRRNLGVAVLALAFLLVPTAVLGSGDGDRPPEFDVAAGGDSTLTTEVIEAVEPGEATAATEPTSVPPAWLLPPPPPGDPPQEAAPPPMSPPASTAPTAAVPGPGLGTTPTTALVCRNSDDPACGPFQWDPAPSPNQPLVAGFTKAPPTAVVGQTLDFEVAWSDADARLTFDRFSADGTVLATACTLAPRFGPWTPPAGTRGEGRLSYSHTFQEAGTYRVIVSLGTADCGSPYGSEKVIETTVTVEPVVETG